MYDNDKRKPPPADVSPYFSVRVSKIPLNPSIVILASAMLVATMTLRSPGLGLSKIWSICSLGIFE
jgi:hypothetical protein